MYRVVSLYHVSLMYRYPSRKMYRKRCIGFCPYADRRVTDCIGCIAPKEGSDTLYRCIANSQSPSQEAFVTSWPCIEHWYGLQLSFYSPVVRSATPPRLSSDDSTRTTSKPIQRIISHASSARDTSDTLRCIAIHCDTAIYSDTTRYIVSDVSPPLCLGWAILV